MLEKKYVTFYARSSLVDLMIAERDIILSYVLCVLSNSILPQLAFKGGTCLKKVYYGKTGRFSMDLDFTSISIKREELRDKFMQLLHNKTHYDVFFKIVDENVRSESYLAVIKYAHAWNLGSEFEIQVSFRERPILPIAKLPLYNEMYLKYCEFQSFTVRCLQKEELMAEKIRAAFQRVRSRDLYDLYLFTKHHYNRNTVKKLVVVKCWNSRDPFNPKALFDKIASAAYDWNDLQKLVRKGSLLPQRDLIKAVLKEYVFLEDLDHQLLKIMKDSKAHKENELVTRLQKNISTTYS